MTTAQLSPANDIALRNGNRSLRHSALFITQLP